MTVKVMGKAGFGLFSRHGSIGILRPQKPLQKRSAPRAAKLLLAKLIGCAYASRPALPYAQLRNLFNGKQLFRVAFPALPHPVPNKFCRSVAHKQKLTVI